MRLDLTVLAAMGALAAFNLLPALRASMAGRAAPAARSARANDEYDGHGDYLQRPWTPGRSPGGPSMWVDGIFQVSFAFTLAHWVQGLADGQREITQIIFIGFAFVFGLMFALAVFASVVENQWQRAVAHVVCAGIFGIGYVMPLGFSDRSEAVTSIYSSLEHERSTQTELQNQLRSRWLADIEAAGAHGAAGAEPPMLEIIDGDTIVQVRNITNQDIHCVRIIRGVCRMKTDDNDCAPLEAHRALKYTLPDSAECRGLPLEFEVGDPLHPDPSWLSDAALLRLKR